MPQQTSKREVKRASAPKTTARRRRRKPKHEEISERAYFIHLESRGGDELENWLRAERELSAA